jgi:hypothetical protein
MIAMLMRLLAFGTLVVLAGPASAQETVNNPDYANWSKFSKGTSVTRVWTSVNIDGRTSVVVTETLTLVEVAADKVVLDVEYISHVPGAPRFKTKPKSREIPKTVSLPADGKKNELAAKLPGAVEEGKEVETVKVPGGEFKTKWFRTVRESGKKRTEGKSWVSDEVPGRLVKAEETTSSNGMKLYTTVREVVEVKKP